MSCWIYSASYSLHLGTLKAAVKIFCSEQGHEAQAPHPHHEKANETVLNPWEGQVVSGPAHLNTSGPLYPLHLVSTYLEAKLLLTLIPSRALWDSWAQSFSVFPISLIIGNILHSASMTFPEFQQGKFKQLLIREGRGDLINQEDQGEIVQRNSSAASGRVLPPHQYTHRYLWAALQILKPLQEGEVNVNNDMLPTSTETPDRIEPDWWCWLLFTLPAANRKNVHEPITPSLNHCYKTPYHPSSGKHQVLASLAHCAPFAWQSNKAIPSYFTQSFCLWDLIQCWSTESRFSFNTTNHKTIMRLQTKLKHFMFKYFFKPPHSGTV